MDKFKRNAILVIIALTTFFILNKSRSFFSNIEKNNTANHFEEENSFADQQYRIDTKEQNEFKRSKRSQKSQFLKKQAKFKFKANPRKHQVRAYKDEQINEDELNIAQAPKPNNINKNDKIEKAKIKDSDDSEDSENDDTDVAKEDSDESEEEEEIKDTESMDGFKEEQIANENLDINKYKEEIESKDLSLTAPSKIEDIVSFTPNSNHSFNNTTNSAQNTSNGNSISNNSDDNNEDSDDNADGEEEDNSSNPTTFSFDPVTKSLMETLLTNRDFESIDRILSEGDVDKKTAYYEILTFYSQNPDSQADAKNVLNLHFYNMDSIEILTSHLIDENTNLAEKQISQAYLLGLVRNWPSDGSDAQQFNAVFIEGVNNRLINPTEGELGPDEELYLQLSESIFIKLDEIQAV